VAVEEPGQEIQVETGIKVPQSQPSLTISDNTLYVFFGEVEYDDYGYDSEGTKHYGVGHLHVHHNIVDDLRRLIKTRETKVMDVVADWFSEKFDVDIDEVSIYPKRKNTPVY
jgi:hypothetical protein